MSTGGRGAYRLGDEGLDVYPVGVLRDVWWLYRIARFGSPKFWPALRRTLREWTGLHNGHRCSSTLRGRSSWNGYLAEPYHLPDGLRTVGHGWTKRRAVASLNRYVERDCSSASADPGASS